MLSAKDFEQVVKNAPLFSIDLVLLNKDKQVLLGKRLNSPAKGKLFVPGGRVFKNESLDEAFNRISLEEVGMQIERNNAFLLGLFDHQYRDSFFENGVSTHYINAAYVAHVEVCDLNLSLEQHSGYVWTNLLQLEINPDIHSFSKVFLPELYIYLKGI